jgi:hypothetical protein
MPGPRLKAKEKKYSGRTLAENKIREVISLSEPEDFPLGHQGKGESLRDPAVRLKMRNVGLAKDHTGLRVSQPSSDWCEELQDTVGASPTVAQLCCPSFDSRTDRMGLAEHQIPHPERVVNPTAIVFPPDQFSSPEEVLPGGLPSGLDVSSTRRRQKVSNSPHISQRIVGWEPQKQLKRNRLVALMPGSVKSKLDPRKFLIPSSLPVSMEGNESGPQVAIKPLSMGRLRVVR